MESSKKSRSLFKIAEIAIKSNNIFILGSGASINDIDEST